MSTLQRSTSKVGGLCFPLVSCSGKATKEQAAEQQQRKGFGVKLTFSDSVYLVQVDFHGLRWVCYSPAPPPPRPIRLLMHPPPITHHPSPASSLLGHFCGPSSSCVCRST